MHTLARIARCGLISLDLDLDLDLYLDLTLVLESLYTLGLLARPICAHPLGRRLVQYYSGR